MEFDINKTGLVG